MAEYCVYLADDQNTHLFPPIEPGDMICVDCPRNRKCPSGPVIRLRDKRGNTGTVRVKTTADSSCGRCPREGKDGYHFASEDQREGSGEDL